MADVQVKAKLRGQKPDRSWANEGEAFTIDERLVSKRWMTVLGVEVGATAVPLAAKLGDDLTRIKGVGEASALKLAEMGVTTFAQVAAWTPEDVTAMDDALNAKGKIVTNDWVGQAATLAPAE
mgnify:CR=1 FL=1